MKKLVLLLLLAACSPRADSTPASADLTRWEQRAANVTITRDDWGIAHVRGKTDADAVFGMIYAQAEDDFNRVETNYLNAIGRLAEAEGEKEIWRDLRMKMFIDPDSMRAKYAASPDSLKALMDAWADGLNYYLHTHKDVKPRVIARFEPWMPLSFSEGSIGGDIETIRLRDLEAFYGKRAAATVAAAEAGPREPSGSNGFAIAPENTANGRALLLINPHTSFFFRSELQMTSDEGLNAYGAATWGQFFIYQGFNDRLGWMHTSSGVDVIDEFVETVSERGGKWYYKYGAEERAVVEKKIAVPYKSGTGSATREFTVFYTHHGPIVRDSGDRWVSVSLMQRPVEALSQSYGRTKARDYDAFRKVMDLKANSSNNTIYADADGNIAYFHPNFIPRREGRFEWGKPVDGSDPKTAWGELHSVEDSPFLKNPPNGWIQNTNNWPYSAAGAHSPRRTAFARYMDDAGENARGVHAIEVLDGKKDFTIASLTAAAYDPWLPAFDRLLPPLLQAYDALPRSDPRKAALAEQVDSLRKWDRRWSATSVPTALAVYWGEALFDSVASAAREEDIPVYEYASMRSTPAQRLAALAEASQKLESDFGTWRTPWGEINRFQRLTSDIVQPFADSGASTPVGFTSATWGSLASFGARRYPGTRRMYGTSGNSFVAVVEFGKDSVRARAVTAGGESGDPKSKHFNDQATRYATGDLREVYFYPSQLAGHTERTYRPGQ